MDDEFTGLGQVLGQQGSPHVTAQGILEGKAEENTSFQMVCFHPGISYKEASQSTYFRETLSN